MATMSSKQWYQVLLENYVTMEVKLAEQRTWRPIRVELHHPSVDWERIWLNLKLKGLNPDQKSFCFKLLHNILPTKSRLHRLKLKETPNCTHCNLGIVEDCFHALLSCPYNNDVNTWIADLLRDHLPALTPENITTLNINLDPDMQFPVIWFLSTVFPLVWHLRQAKKAISLYSIRADIEAKVNILRKSRLKDAARLVEEWINF